MQTWAKFISRTAWLWIAVWGAAAVAAFFAPNIPSLLGEDARSFLPPDSPSQQAINRMSAEFPNSAHASRAVILFFREGALTQADRESAAALASALAGESAKWNWHVTGPALNPVLRPLLESADGMASIVVVDLPAGSLTSHTVKRFRIIESAVHSLARPAGLQVEITGGAAMGGLLDSNAKRDVDKTTIWAIGAVAAILLFVYRSPAAMLLPMLTIAASLLASLGLVGWLGSLGWPINSLVQMFMVVIVVGVGTDYCLFLFSRFREDLAARADGWRAASEASVRHAGPAVLASAGTNALGLATLWLAQNRDLHTSGPTVALSIVVSGACVMTLSAALICLGGHWFVGRRSGVPESDHRVWRWAGDVVSRRPLTIAFTVGTALVLASALGAWKREEPVYDSLEQFPADSSFVRGARLYARHFQNDKPVTDATVLITFPDRIDGQESGGKLRELLEVLNQHVKRRFSIEHYRDLADPLGLWREPGAGAEGSELPRAIIEQFARPTYIGQSGKTVRIDLGIEMEPRSIRAMHAVNSMRETLKSELGYFSGAELKAAEAVVEIGGETAVYADMRKLRIRDFKVVALAAVGMIFVVLLMLLRSIVQSAILIAGTLLTYLTAYGLTWLVARLVFGSPALAWQIDFLLFIVVLSLGQDYNIFVVARIHEELKKHGLKDAVAIAVSRTGSVVSSCGVIMAATFASMFSGSLMMMKEFAISLSLAMLIDTFVVRPLLVPALILVLNGRAKGSNTV